MQCVRSIYVYIYICIYMFAICRTYFDCWQFLSALIHLPRIRREVFIFPLSFNLSPSLRVLVHLSEPARSHSDNLKAKIGKFSFLALEYALIIYHFNQLFLEKGFFSLHLHQPFHLFSIASPVKFDTTSCQTPSQKASYISPSSSSVRTCMTS